MSPGGNLKGLDVESFTCPDPARCKAATTVDERREHCDYVMRLYAFDAARPAGGRGVLYLDIADHVDATTGDLWFNDGSGWSTSR